MMLVLFYEGVGFGLEIGFVDVVVLEEWRLYVFWD